jgi:hypothetical protein
MPTLGGTTMKTLREVLQDAEYRRPAVGHFNFSELTVLKAVGEAARAYGRMQLRRRPHRRRPCGQVLLTVWAVVPVTSHRQPS